VYENGVLYNAFANEQTVVSERRSFINGRTISLVALQGQYSTGSSGSLTIGTTPISGPAQEVTIFSNSDPITITIPTRLPASEWREILEDELVSNGGYIQEPLDSDTSDGLTVELVPGENYNLRLAAVGVGSEFDTETEEEYIVDVSGNGETVPEGGSQRLVAQVRDKFNNPVSDVAVAADASAGSVDFVDSQSRTDSDGIVTLDYNAGGVGSSTESRTVTVWFVPDSDNPLGTDPNSVGFDEAHKVQFDLDAVPSGTGGPPDPTSGGNPINPADIRLVNSSFNETGCNGRSDACSVNLQLENRGSVTQEIDELRISYYSVNNGAGGGQDFLPPQFVLVDDGQFGEGDINTGDRVELDGSFQSVSVSDIGSGATRSYNFAFQKFEEKAKNNAGFENGAIQGDVFVVEVKFREQGTTEERYVTYFVAPY
jgi:hypothetical protein